MEKLRPAIYIRVSTKDQKSNGFSLDAQRRELEEYIEKRNDEYYSLNKDHIFIDNQSGSSDKKSEREALLKMLDAVSQNKIDTILVVKLDRLSRSLKDLLDIIELLQGVRKKYQKNVSLISLRENIDFRGSIGNLIFQIFGALAEFERSVISERTITGIIESAQQNNYTGGAAPFGYKKVKNINGGGSKLFIVEDEAEVVRQMHNLYVYERNGHEQIQKKIDVLLSSYKIQKRFSPEVIGKMLKNTVYKGEYIEKRGASKEGTEAVISYHPAIIDASEWEIAQEISRNNTSRGGLSTSIYMLSGLLKYKDIDGTKTSMVGAADKRRGYDTYRTNGKQQKPLCVSQKAINDVVWNYLKAVIDNPEAFFSYFLQQEKQKQDGYKVHKERIRSLRKLLSEIDSNKASALEKYIQNKLSEADYNKLNNKYESTIEEYEKQIREAENELSVEVHLAEDKKLLEEFVKHFRSLDNIMDTENVAYRKTICKAFIKEIIINASGDIEIHMKLSTHQRDLLEKRWVRTHSSTINTTQNTLSTLNNCEDGGGDENRTRVQKSCI